MKKSVVKSAAAVVILAALVFVLLRYVALPAPLINTTLSLYAAAIAIVAVIFGPVAACLGGFLGNLLVDLTAGWGIWWTWIVATGVFGLVAGLGCKDMNLDENRFGIHEIVRFMMAVLIAAAISWILIAPIGDILIYQEDAKLVIKQGICICISGFVSAAVLGTAGCYAYAKWKENKRSKSVNKS